jgi:hypothetical protein
MATPFDFLWVKGISPNIIISGDYNSLITKLHRQGQGQNVISHRLSEANLWHLRRKQIRRTEGLD